MKYITYTGSILLITGISLLFLGLQQSTYNYVFLMTGGILSIGGYILMSSIQNHMKKKESTTYEKWKNNLITSGIQIPVDLSQCVLKSSHFYEESSEASSLYNKYAYLDELTNQEPTPYGMSQQNILVYEGIWNNNTYTFYSPVIHKETTTLHFLLENKKNTSIYIDPADPENYFFDLDFLRT